MSQGSYRRQWVTGVAVRQQRHDKSSGRKGELAVGPARASIGIAMANTRPSRCDGRQDIETAEAARSLRRTASRCSAPASPSGGIFRRSTGNTAATAHGGRAARKPPLVGRSPEPAWLRARSNPGSRYRQDLPAGRSLPGRCSGSGHHRRSQSTATPIASASPQPAIDPTNRTSRGVIPPFSGHSRQMQRFKSANQAQRFLSTHALIYGHFRPRRHLMAAAGYRRVRVRAFRTWRQETCVHRAA